MLKQETRCPNGLSGPTNRTDEAFLGPPSDLTHVAETPLGERHDAAADPEELLHHAAQRALIPLLAPDPVPVFVLGQREGAFSRRSWFVSGGCGCSRTPNRAKRTQAASLGRAHLIKSCFFVVPAKNFQLLQGQVLL